MQDRIINGRSNVDGVNNVDSIGNGIRDYVPKKLTQAIALEYTIDDICTLVKNKFKFGTIRLINEGKVHYVYFCEKDDGDRFVLKIRSNHFRSNDEIFIDPSAIETEYQAYNIIKDKKNEFVSDIVEYNKKYGYLLLKFLPFPNLEKKIKNITDDEIILLSGELGKFHSMFSGVHLSDLEQEEVLYKNNLYYRFGFLGDDRIYNLMEDLYKKRSCLIHGDITPENIFIDKESNNIKVIDLETVHFGNNEFDVGFLLAHIIIKNISDSHLKGKILLFLENYSKFYKIDKLVVFKCIGATIKYRIFSGFPYIDNMYKKELEELSESLIDGKFDIN